MPNPIPDFDHNLVLPPHIGNPTHPGELSPYPCTTPDLCRRFGTTPERRKLLGRFLDFRNRLRDGGLTQGFQWMDGSFLEDVETRENRAPHDIDVVTVYWGYDRQFQERLRENFPESANPRLAKEKYSIDHYPFDASTAPETVLFWMRYWILLFSHNRQGVWKGMLQIALNTPDKDAEARQQLENSQTP